VAKIIKGKKQVVKNLEESMASPAPNVKSAKRTHTVENVRMIGEDHAVVDSSVEAPVKSTEGGPGGAYHAVAVMVRKGGKWLFEDLRSYVILSTQAAQAQGGAPVKAESAAPAKKEAAAPGKESAPPAKN
jgi:hypothetical protein